MRFTSRSEAASTRMQSRSRASGGAGVVEIVTDYRSDTFRCIYTVRIAGKVYVLHVFQKKSKSGRATPKPEIRLIEQRLREAERLHQEQGHEEKKGRA
jgi:phage-related protein